MIFSLFLAGNLEQLTLQIIQITEKTSPLIAVIQGTPNSREGCKDESLSRTSFDYDGNYHLRKTLSPSSQFVFNVPSISSTKFECIYTNDLVTSNHELTVVCLDHQDRPQILGVTSSRLVYHRLFSLDFSESSVEEGRRRQL